MVAERVSAEIGTGGLIIGDGTARRAFGKLGHVVDLPENLRVVARLMDVVRPRVTLSAKAGIVDAGCGNPEKTPYRGHEPFWQGREMRS
jgi:hypothetical protein